MDSLSRFKADIRKASEKRTVTVTNSYGTRDAFFFYRHNRIQESKYVLSDVQFDKIVRMFHEKYVEMLLNGETVYFPQNMGRLYMASSSVVYYKDKNNKIRIYNPVNWSRTLEWWYNDEEARKNKRVLIYESDERLVTVFDKKGIKCRNMYNYQFHLSRNVINEIGRKFRNNELNLKKI